MRIEAQNLAAGAIFAVLSLPMLIWLAIVTPPFQVPDEPAHYRYALAISLGEFLPSVGPDSTIGAVLPTYTEALIAPTTGLAGHSENRFSGAQRAAIFGVRDDGKTQFTRFSGSDLYAPVIYAAPALGLAFARLLDLPPARAMLAGRISNALLFVLLCAVAVLIAPAPAHGPMLAVLLLPMTLFQAASYSADGPVFALSALIAALMLREMASDHQRSTAVGVAVALAIGIAASAKIPMMALVIPLAVVFGRRHWTRGVGLAILALVLPLAWYLSAVHLSPHEPTGASHAQQIAGLLASPTRILDIAVNTIATYYDYYLETMVGVLGSLDTSFPHWIYLFIYFALIATLVAAALAGPFAAGKSLMAERLALVVGVILAVGMTYGALYAMWTPVGNPTVLGVQGRYLIPCLLILAIAFAGIGRSRSSGWVSLAIATTAACVWIPATGWLIVIRYYLS